MDSEGNIYIIGQFSVGAAIDSTLLLPMAPFGPSANTLNTVIANLSPEGGVLWCKAIHQNDGSPAFSWDMHLVGDTVLVCMVGIYFIHSQNGYIYFLDTLIRDNEYLIENYNLVGPALMGMITLDTAGNLKEKHFLQIGLADSTGHILTYEDVSGNEMYRNCPYVEILSNELFNVDKHGNIYICRKVAYDVFLYHDGHTISVEDGGIAALVVFVDGHPRHTIYPDKRYNKGNSMIMKFSHNFDTLYWNHYIFDTSSNFVISPYITSLSIDSNDNFYVTMEYGAYGVTNEADIRINNSDSLFYHSRPSDYVNGCLLAFSPDQQPLYIKQLCSASESTGESVYYSFLSSSIDEESGSIVTLGVAGADDQTITALLVIDDDTLNFHDSTTLDLSSLPSGIYILRIITDADGSDHASYHKVVKQ